MKLNHTLPLVGVLALAGLMIGGCSKQQGTASADQPVFLDQLPATDEPRSGVITTAMWRYDAGIGDTASQIGGGGNAE